MSASSSINRVGLAIMAVALIMCGVGLLVGQFESVDEDEDEDEE